MSPKDAKAVHKKGATTITWKPPANYPKATYFVRISKPDAPSRNTQWDFARNPKSTHRLRAKTRYVAQIVAASPAGSSPPLELRFTTPSRY